MRELEIPEKAASAPDAIEMMRFWLLGGEEHVSLFVGAMGDREAQQWGMMLADLSTHIIRALKQNGTPGDEAALRSKIEQAYSDRLKLSGLDVSGSLIGTRQ